MYGLGLLGNCDASSVAYATEDPLSLNVGKTEATTFGSDFNVNELQELDLPSSEVQGSVHMPFVDAVTNLNIVTSFYGLGTSMEKTGRCNVND